MQNSDFAALAAGRGGAAAGEQRNDRLRPRRAVVAVQLQTTFRDNSDSKKRKKKELKTRRAAIQLALFSEKKIHKKATKMTSNS